MNKNKKEAAQEIQGQLNKNELECIFRHLREFILTNWDKKENVPNACYDCNRHCSASENAVDPWPTFYKLSNLAGMSKNEVVQEPLNKQDNGHIDL